MNFKYTALFAAILTASTGIVGCSSSSPSSTPPTATETSTTGRITGFGSVFVNGVEFETDTATLTKDGTVVNVPTDQSLKIGMIVTLKGSANGRQGTATEIEFDDELEGLVQTNGIASGAGLMVMGQKVSVDGNTNFESDDATITALEDIPVNAVVEISGYADGDGNILATYIELKATEFASYDDEMEVKGVIANLDTSANTFSLGTMTVDYSPLINALDLKLVNDLYVEVKFSVDVNGDLIATSIELENEGEYGVKGDEGEELEIEGLISNIDLDAGTFELNGQIISIPDNFEMPAYTGGELVTVEVNVNENGEFILHEIEEDDASDDDNNNKLVGLVSEIVIASDGETAVITVDGNVISLDKFNTIMKDDSAAEVKYFNLTDIATGDWLEMKLSEDAQGGLSAVKVERIDEDDASEESEIDLTLIEGVLYAGDINLSTELSSDIIALLTTYVNNEAGDNAEIEVEVVSNPANGALEQLTLELEGEVGFDGTTVSINATPLNAITLVDEAMAATLALNTGLKVELKINLLTGQVQSIKYEIEGGVVVDEAGAVTVDGVVVTLPSGLLLETGMYVEVELDANGMVLSMDIDHQYEMQLAN